MEKPSRPVTVKGAAQRRPIYWIAAAGCLLFYGCGRGAAERRASVSYGGEIAPIFALHCNGCHGGSAPSSNFETSNYRGLRSGGVLGDDIVPGAPDRSMLVKFVEGFRGPEQRMPLGAAPLSARQVALIRRWIAEGAINDHAPTPCYRLRLPPCDIVPGHRLILFAKISGDASLVWLLHDRNHRVLYRREASIKNPPEPMDVGVPGDLLSWTLNTQADWPEQVEAELWVRYAADPVNVFASVRNSSGATFDTQQFVRAQCTPD